MSRRFRRLVPLAAAILAIASAAPVLASGPLAARKAKGPAMAKEVVVLVRVGADGAVTVTPETAYVRTSQRLVLVAFCDKLDAKFLEKKDRIPDFRCQGAECTLVGPAVSKPTSAGYTVWGTCGGKAFGKDPVLIFIP